MRRDQIEIGKSYAFRTSNHGAVFVGVASNFEEKEFKKYAWSPPRVVKFVKFAQARSVQDLIAEGGVKTKRQDLFAEPRYVLGYGDVYLEEKRARAALAAEHDAKEALHETLVAWIANEFGLPPVLEARYEKEAAEFRAKGREVPEWCFERHVESTSKFGLRLSATATKKLVAILEGRRSKLAERRLAEGS